MKSFFNKVDINEDNNLIFFLYSMSLKYDYYLPKNIIEIIDDKFNIKPRFYGYPNFDEVERIIFEIIYNDIDLVFGCQYNDYLFIASYSR